MHELGIAQSILEIAREHVPSEDVGRVALIRVRLGPLCGVVGDSLAFCFEALVSDSPFPGARLVIEAVPLVGRCLDCNRTVESTEWIPSCPHCLAGRLQIERGDDLSVSQIELSDPPAEAS